MKKEYEHPAVLRYRNFCKEHLYDIHAFQAKHIEKSQGNERRVWPKNVFVPSWYAFEILNRKFQDPHTVKQFDYTDDSLWGLVCCSAWRLTLGVYRFDPSVYKALFESSSSIAKIPSEVFNRLPAWCVYIETPGLVFPDVDHEFVRGFWVYIDSRPTISSSCLLNLVFDIVYGDGLPQTWRTLRLDIEDLTTEDMVANTEYETFLLKVLSLVLWLCAEKPDEDLRDEPFFEKKNQPSPVKIKGQFKYIPPHHATIHNVAERIGSEIRNSRDELSRLSTGKRVRAHIRKAHWHGVWTGPEGNRVYKLNWWPPVLVGGLANTKNA